MLLGASSFANDSGLEPKRGSRLNIKVTIKAKKSLGFSKFSKPVAPSLELKPAKTVSLYFSNLLINRNLSSIVAKEQATKSQVVKVVNPAEKPNSESVNNLEPGEKFFNADGLIISNIFPNPADDAGYFEYNFSGSNFNDVKIDFFNVLGSSMNTSVYLDKSDHKVKVHLKDFDNGMYFYQLIADGKTLATKKLLVKHFN
jgi:Secretion system C-terminal sorting domain